MAPEAGLQAEDDRRLATLSRRRLGGRELPTRSRAADDRGAVVQRQHDARLPRPSKRDSYTRRPFQGLVGQVWTGWSVAAHSR